MFGAKVVSFSSEELDRIKPSKLSDGILQIIRESGVASLEPLAGPNPEQHTRRILENYWAVEH